MIIWLTYKDRLTLCQKAYYHLSPTLTPGARAVPAHTSHSRHRRTSRLSHTPEFQMNFGKPKEGKGKSADEFYAREMSSCSCLSPQQPLWDSCHSTAFLTSVQHGVPDAVGAHRVGAVLRGETASASVSTAHDLPSVSRSGRSFIGTKRSPRSMVPLHSCD